MHPKSEARRCPYSVSSSSYTNVVFCLLYWNLEVDNYANSLIIKPYWLYIYEEPPHSKGCGVFPSLCLSTFITLSFDSSWSDSDCEHLFYVLNSAILSFSLITGIVLLVDWVVGGGVEMIELKCWTIHEMTLLLVQVKFCVGWKGDLIFCFAMCTCFARQYLSNITYLVIFLIFSEVVNMLHCIGM